MDDYAGGYQATSYLVALGHRRIAFVSGPAELGSVQERYRGYRDALRKAGIDPDGQVNLAGQFTEQFGMSALPHLLAAAEPPTAAFVASDYIALGVLSRGRDARHPGARRPVDRRLRRHQVRPVRAAAADHDPLPGRPAGAGGRGAAVRAAGRPPGARPAPRCCRSSWSSASRPPRPRWRASEQGGPAMRSCSAARAGSPTACTSRASTPSPRARYVEGAGAGSARPWPTPASTSSTCPGTWSRRGSPAPPAELARYEAVILSDIGANSLLLSPDTFERSAAPRPTGWPVEQYVRDGGGLLMIGGYLSFAGIEGKARYHGTPVEDALPVTISETDDRAEMPAGRGARSPDAGPPGARRRAARGLARAARLQPADAAGRRAVVWCAAGTTRSSPSATTTPGAAPCSPPTARRTGARRRSWTGRGMARCGRIS